MPSDKAVITVYDLSNVKLFEGKTNSKGLLSVYLPDGDYKVTIDLKSYETYTENIHLLNKVNIEQVFRPDIIFFVDYNSHTAKVNTLMNLSSRVGYVSTTSYDKTKEWMFDYANFIQLDMYTDGPTYSFNTDVLKDSPAYKNYNIAYTFGIYSDALLNSIDLHYVGGSPSNNNVHSLENTYIGSYFQAEDTPVVKILDKNMLNLLDYIKYLINPSKYPNPTLDPTKTPLLASSMGIYHPDYGTLAVSPSQEDINKWILSNPGYNHDGIGSLNWMSDDFSKWQEVNAQPSVFMQTFENWYKQNKPVENSFIVIASYYSGGDLIDSLIRKYESAGRPAFNVYQAGTSPAMSSLLVELAKASTIGISSVNSLYSWSLDYENMANKSAVKNLTDLDVTILKAVDEISKQSYESHLGPQMEWTYAVTIPSFEGVFGAVVTSYVDELGNVHVIDSGVEKLVKMTMGWANLKDKENKDKKVTIVLYNYPPGKAEIGASYLDVFQSTYDLLKILADNGYDIGMSKDELPAILDFTNIITNMGNKGTWAQGLLNQYVEKNWDQLIAHNQLISLDDYYALTADVNKDLMMQLVDKWGDGLGKIMVYDDKYIVIPGIHFGNVFITFQPSRGWEEVANYHDTTLPPHQQYVAFYEWLDKTYKTDAIINMGTHGTLEFLPGHQIGVQDGDWTFELTLIPTIYPYIVSNPGEAMVARDRLGALMITHMTPAIVASELYGNYSELSKAIDGYRNAVKLNVTNNAESYKEEIIKLAKNLGFEKQKDGQSFDEWLDDLHNSLDDLANDFNALGIHTLGHELSGNELVEEVVTIVSSQTKIYNNILALLYPELKSLDFYDDLRSNPIYATQVSAIKSVLYDMVGSIINQTTCDQLAEIYTYSKNSALYNDTLYIAEVILKIYANNEWNALISALNGGYIEGGLFADPAYADSIPVGYNGYATDHTKVPSKASYESAKKIVNILLRDYYEEHGEWPELTALILWGTEISRTEGIGISEFLYFLGCKPTWSRTGTVDGVELLPLEDLKVTLSNGAVVNRPRVDVYASMVTSNSNWIKWMLTATKLALNAPGETESMNFVKKHYAENPTLDRLFGLPGNILEGTGVSNLMPNTADWDINTVHQELTDIYMNKVSYSWTLDEDGKIVINQEKENYKYLLGKTDLISQNLDSTWRVLDSDDYYDWNFGLLNAAKHFGAKPDNRFVDIRNKNNYESKEAIDQIYFEVRSTLLNPKYLGEYGKTPGGMNAWSSKIQILTSALVVMDGSLNNEMYLQLAKSVSSMKQYVNSDASAAAFQSASANLIYQALYNSAELKDVNGNKMDFNTFNNLLSNPSSQDFNKFLDALDPESKAALQELANDMVETGAVYGVACCHHTCKNINFNEILLQMSTLNPDKKQEYMKQLEDATLKKLQYQVPSQEQPNNGDQQEEGGEVNQNATSSDSSLNGMVNGSSQQNNGDSTGGISPVGDQPRTESNADSSASDSSASGAQSDSNAATANVGSDSKAYEITKDSADSSSNPEASTPGIVIVSVISLMLLFGFGYVRKRGF